MLFALFLLCLYKDNNINVTGFFFPNPAVFSQFSCLITKVVVYGIMMFISYSQKSLHCSFRMVHHFSLVSYFSCTINRSYLQGPKTKTNFTLQNHFLYCTFSPLIKQLFRGWPSDAVVNFTCSTLVA